MVSNVAGDAAGGIYDNAVEVDLTNTPVTDDRPSNCAGSPTPVSGLQRSAPARASTGITDAAPVDASIAAARSAAP